jgi:hypothetical protein
MACVLFFLFFGHFWTVPLVATASRVWIHMWRQFQLCGKKKLASVIYYKCPWGDVINLATKSLHPSLSNYLHYSYPNNMAKSMTKGLQNSTHVSKLKWADPKLAIVMNTKDKTLFVLALSICCHHISPTVKCSYIWKKIQSEIFLCTHSNKLQTKVQSILQFAFQK